MITHIFLIVICLNGSMGIVMMDGSPFSPLIGATGGGCVYSATIDVTGSNTDMVTFNPDTGETATDLSDDIVAPESGGTIFDPITQTLERSAQALQIFINIVDGQYIATFIEKTAIGCELDTNPASETYNYLVPITNPVFEAFKAIFHTIVIFLGIIAVFYILSGRGFILSS